MIDKSQSRTSDALPNSLAASACTGYAAALPAYHVWAGGENE